MRWGLEGLHRAAFASPDSVSYHMSKAAHVVNCLARCVTLDAHQIRSVCASNSISSPSTSFLKEIRKLAKGYLSEGQYGRLHATVLVTMELGGIDALQELESQGVLLSKRGCSLKFRRFTKRLHADAVREPTWAFLVDRILTYEASTRLIEHTEQATVALLRASRKRNRIWLKQLMGLVELIFLRNYFDVGIPAQTERLLASFLTPEELASSVSRAIAVANEVSPLDGTDLGAPSLGDLCTDEIQEVLLAAQLLNAVHDAVRLVAGFGYSLRWEQGSVGPVAILSAPSPEFERSVQIGFIRGILAQNSIALDMLKHGTLSNPSLMQYAERISAELCGSNTAVVGPRSRSRRLRLEVPLVPDLVRSVLNYRFSDEEGHLRDLDRNYLLPLGWEEGLPIQLTDNLNYEDLLRLYKVLRFYCMIDITSRKRYIGLDSTIFTNSLVRVIGEKGLREVLALAETSQEAIDDFISVFVADVSELGRYDLQYTPLLKIQSVSNPDGSTPEAEYVQLPAVLAASNITRNAQIRGNTRFHKDGRKFVQLMSEKLRRHFSKLVIERRLRAGDVATEIDIAFLCDSHLYLVECKHSITATDPHEMRDLWRDVRKGTRQIERATLILQEPERRRSYLRAWFPHLTVEEIDGLSIVGVVLSSHRLFSGLKLDGVSIRDSASLMRLVSSGAVSMGSMAEDGTLTMKTFRLWESEALGCRDIENYFSVDSVLHSMYSRSMIPQYTFQQFHKLTIARESYIFVEDDDEWAEYMQAQGYERLPDEIHRPPTMAEIETLLDEKLRASQLEEGASSA